MPGGKGYKWSNRYFSDFVETTTINGVFHIFRGRSKIRQMLWGLLVISAFIGYTVTFGYVVKKYIDKPTASTITQVISSEKEGIPFPLVTICNFNIYENPVFRSTLVMRPIC